MMGVYMAVRSISNDKKIIIAVVAYIGDLDSNKSFRAKWNLNLKSKMRI